MTSCNQPDYRIWSITLTLESNLNQSVRNHICQKFFSFSQPWQNSFFIFAIKIQLLLRLNQDKSNDRYSPWDSNLGCRMKGSDKSTKLWRPPCQNIFAKKNKKNHFCVPPSCVPCGVDSLSKVRKWDASEQCDQMARLIFQYLAIYNNENLPNSIRKLPKYVQNFAKY